MVCILPTVLRSVSPDLKSMFSRKVILFALDLPRLNKTEFTAQQASSLISLSRKPTNQLKDPIAVHISQPMTPTPSIKLRLPKARV